MIFFWQFNCGYLNSSLSRQIPLLVEWCLWKVQISVRRALNRGLCFGGSRFWNFSRRSAVEASPSPAEFAWNATKFRISVKSSMWSWLPLLKLSGRKRSALSARTTAQLLRRFIRWRSSLAEIGAEFPGFWGFFPIFPNRGRPDVDGATNPFDPVLNQMFLFAPVV